MRGIAPGDGRRLPVMGLLEPGFDPLRAAMIPAGARRVRQLGEADRLSRHADDADLAVAEFEVGRGAFQQICGDRLPYVPRDRDHRLSRQRRRARHAQEMAAHESPCTTKLYDRPKERLTRDEVERIRL